MGKDFKPAFIVQNPYYNLMIPFMYTSNAIKFTGIEYYNPPGTVRHPYDDDDADRFRDYLKQHLKCKNGRWGPTLRLNDLDWKAEKGRPPYLLDPFLQALSFFDARETLIRQHPVMKEIGWTEELMDKILQLPVERKVCDI
jgi:hypothetical protein